MRTRTTASTTPSCLRLFAILSLALLTNAHDAFEARSLHQHHHRHRDIAHAQAARGLMTLPTAAPLVGLGMMERVVRRQATSTSPTSASSSSSSSTSSSGVTTSTTATTTTNPCAPSYTGATTTIKGTGTLPRTTVSGFVKRSNTGLTLNSKAYRIVGPNVYWLGLDENYGDPRTTSYPSKQRIREAMAITVAMGGNTIRSHTLGSSTGGPLSVWPALNKTNTAAFDTIDYAIFAARNYGIRLVIPLVDNYKYYHGGKYDFIGWRGFNTSAADSYKYFYNTTTIVNDYKLYISTILNRVNSYTGVAYKNDPTILAWETGNELGSYNLKEGAPPGSWTTNIGKYIKSLAPNHLVIDGTNGVYYPGTTKQVPGVNVTQVDIMTDHFYPTNDAVALQDWKYATAASKNVLFGEFDWTVSTSALTSFLNTVEKNSTNSGDMLWSLFGHDDNCCAFVPHNDGYSLYYPNGNTVAQQANILQVAQHWYRMSGRTAPTKLVAVQCPQPELVK